jgi:hypothetical protein
MSIEEHATALSWRRERGWEDGQGVTRNKRKPGIKRADHAKANEENLVFEDAEPQQNSSEACLPNRNGCNAAYTTARNACACLFTGMNVMRPIFEQDGAMTSDG